LKLVVFGVTLYLDAPLLNAYYLCQPKKKQDNIRKWTMLKK